MSKDKLPKIIELKIGSTHAIIVGHKPDQVCAEGLCENLATKMTAEQVASFGLFGGSADPNKFYPDIQPSDWTPQEEDFIRPIFRGFSAGYVVHGGIPISFKKDGVLKDSLSMAKGITINTNHDTDVEHAIGAVADVTWQEAYKVGGLTIPAGLNLVMKIDAKSNPRIARGILMDPPSIHSDSVTVRFAWEKSHPEMEDFWDKVGTFDKDGNLVCVVANKISGYQEVSLVHHGADPYAQAQKDGKILDPTHAETQKE